MAAMYRLALAFLACTLAGAPAAARPVVEEASITQLQAMMASGRASSEVITRT
jgi:hypothetical protein